MKTSIQVALIIINIAIIQTIALPIVLPVQTSDSLYKPNSSEPVQANLQTNELLSEAILESFDEESHAIVALINNTIEQTFPNQSETAIIATQESPITVSQIINDVLDSFILVKLLRGTISNLLADLSLNATNLDELTTTSCSNNFTANMNVSCDQ